MFTCLLPKENFKLRRRSPGVAARAAAFLKCTTQNMHALIRRHGSDYIAVRLRVIAEAMQQRGEHEAARDLDQLAQQFDEREALS